MKAVILAAGEGSRLRPFTSTKPKALAEVAGEPLLHHSLRSLARLGATSVVIVVGHRGDDIVELYGSGFEGLPIEYVIQEHRSGLAHALLCAEPFVRSDFMVLHGDNFFRARLKPLVQRHVVERPAASLLVESVLPASANRGVCLFDSTGHLIRIAEFPTPEEALSDQRWVGFHLFSPTIFEACRAVATSQRGEYELPEAVNWLIDRGHEIEWLPLDGRRVNINEPKDLERAERLLLG